MDASAGAIGREASMEPPFERVYTIDDYYDGPRAGFADFCGVPHAYLSIWLDDAEDWDPAYRLWPVSPEVLALAQENWGIWERWQDAFCADETTEETHPALPADAPRHEEIEPVIMAFLDTAPADARRALGDFRLVDRQAPLGWTGKMRPLEVCWTPVDSPAEENVG